MTPLTDFEPGGPFLQLEGREGLPEDLRDTLPKILWIPPALREAEGAAGQVILAGRPVGHPDGPIVPLVALGSTGQPFPCFRIAETIEGILLEKYHSGLEPILEMRLPFNYSRFPNWIKGLARRLRRSALVTMPRVPFPGEQPSAVVDWLRQLASWLGRPGDERGLTRGWPNGCRAAVVITHDVDTDWLFRNPRWLERFCDLEEKHGLAGAWYCVPTTCRTPAAARGLERLLARGCEVGCHGYNHDARWPLLTGERFQRRLETVRLFAKRWGAQGFRSEWLWRTPTFLGALADIFTYDSSVPSASFSFTRETGNGCGTCLPYRTHGGLIELPLTLPMDEARIPQKLEPFPFWEGQVERAARVIALGGLVVLSLHPQPHQAANDATLAAVDAALGRLTALPNLWLTRPDQVAVWVSTPDPGPAGETP